MNHIRTNAILASGLALALAACGGEPAEDVEANPAADAEANATAEYDPMQRDYTLTGEDATRRAEFDIDSFQEEYAGYRDEIVSEQVSSGDDSSGNELMSEDERAEMQAAAEPRDASTNMRAREHMTWSYLDRNGDDRLSVAEYAIWAIPLDPTAPARNDETAPYLTAQQANKAADSFFYYDIDDDTYLERREFTAARRGENFDA